MKEDKCGKCGVVLVSGENWWPSLAKRHKYICIECAKARRQKYYQKRLASNETHTCRVCGVELTDDNWWISQKKRGNYVCIECSTARLQQHYQENKDEILVKARQYRKKHHERYLAYYRQYHLENRDERLAYNRRYYQENIEEERERGRQFYWENRTEILEKSREQYWEHRDERLAYNRQWQRDNPEKCRKRTRRRRAQKAKVTIGEVDEAAVYELYNSHCVYCGSTENLTLDHVVPISKGGAHHQENLVISCGSCNSSKRDKPLEEWLQMKPYSQAWVM